MRFKWDEPEITKWGVSDIKIAIKAAHLIADTLTPSERVNCAIRVLYSNCLGFASLGTTDFPPSFVPRSSNKSVQWWVYGALAE